MKTNEKIEQLSDIEIISVYQGFSGYLLGKIDLEAGEVFKNIPPELKKIKDINALTNIEIDDLEVGIIPEEVLPIAKAQLHYWANEPDFAMLLEEYMENNKIKPMAAGTILFVGAVLLTTIISTSLKIERKDGKTTFSYGSSNISSNAVNLVTSFLTAIPESLKIILTKQS